MQRMNNEEILNLIGGMFTGAMSLGKEHRPLFVNLPTDAHFHDYFPLIEVEVMIMPGLDIFCFNIVCDTYSGPRIETKEIGHARASLQAEINKAVLWLKEAGLPVQD